MTKLDIEALRLTDKEISKYEFFDADNIYPEQSGVHIYSLVNAQLAKALWGVAEQLPHTPESSGKCSYRCKRCWITDSLNNAGIPRPETENVH